MSHDLFVTRCCGSFRRRYIVLRESCDSARLSDKFERLCPESTRFCRQVQTRPTWLIFRKDPSRCLCLRSATRPSAGTACVCVLFERGATRPAGRENGRGQTPSDGERHRECPPARFAPGPCARGIIGLHIGASSARSSQAKRHGARDPARLPALCESSQPCANQRAAAAPVPTTNRLASITAVPTIVFTAMR